MHQCNDVLMQNMASQRNLSVRTTLEIRDSVLQAAREEALRANLSIGEVISTWAERGIYASPSVQQVRAEYRSGIRQLERRGELVTNEHIDKLRDELGV